MDDKLIEQFRKARDVQISPDVSEKVMAQIAGGRHRPRRRLLIPALAGVLSTIIMAVLFLTASQPITDEYTVPERIVVITGYPHPRSLYPNPAVTIEFVKLMKGGRIKP